MNNKILKMLWMLLLIPSFAIGQSQTPVPATSFGLHDNHGAVAAGATAFPTVSFGTFRFWDNDGTKWPDIETARGVYSWTLFDAWMAKLNAAAVTDTIYTFGYTPSWCGPAPTLPCTNNQDFIDFITALVNHANGKIQHYETWNEPTSPTFWTGTMAQLVVLQNDVYNTVRALQPTARVHTPVVGVTGGTSDCNNSGGGTYSLNNFVNAMVAANGAGNFHFDVVDLHFYPYPIGTNPEVGVIQYQVANILCGMTNLGIGSKPLWNTEFGWAANTDVPVAADEVAWLARAYLFLWSKGVVRSYWYSYDNLIWGNLENSNALNSRGIAYQQVHNWMVGSTMTTNCALSGSFYTCGLTLANGHAAQAVWYNVWKSPATASYTPASEYTNYHDLAGNTVTIGSGQSVTIGEQPILLESAPNPPTGLTTTVR